MTGILGRKRVRGLCAYAIEKAITDSVRVGLAVLVFNIKKYRVLGSKMAWLGEYIKTFLSYFSGMKMLYAAIAGFPYILILGIKRRAIFPYHGLINFGVRGSFICSGTLVMMRSNSDGLRRLDLKKTFIGRLSVNRRVSGALVMRGSKVRIESPDSGFQWDFR
jgi:hypothetical protein